MSSHGLPPAAFAKLVDVDPPIAAHVLELLDRAAIPAYGEPLVGETGPYRDVRAPDRPTTRIFVERGQLSEARRVVDSGLPELRADFHADAAARVDADDMRRSSAESVDAAWEHLVAGFHTAEPPPRPAVDGPRPGSGLSERLVREHALPPDELPPDEVPSGELSPHEVPASGGPRDYSVLDDPDDETFVPPPPPPIPRPRDRFDSFAWAGVIGGPLAIVAAFVFGNMGWLAAAGFAAFTAGFITLVARSSDRNDDGDGAIV